MKKYVLVEWPDCQIAMDQEWFDECYWAQAEEDATSAPLFVPEERFNQL